MATPNITIYSGVVPDRTQPQAEFSTNVGNFLPYFNTIGPEYNVMATWTNDQLALIQQAIDDGLIDINGAVQQASDYADNSAQSAVESGTYSALSASAANLKGNWQDLTGGLSKPASAYHDGKFWGLLNNLADVTLSEPGVTADWAEIKSGASAESTIGNFTAEAGVIYNSSTGDITLPTLTAGMQFSVHAITDNVRILNPTNTIKNGTRSIIAGDDLLLRNGQTVSMTATSTTELEVR